LRLIHEPFLREVLQSNQFLESKSVVELAAQLPRILQEPPTILFCYARNIILALSILPVPRLPPNYLTQALVDTGDAAGSAIPDWEGSFLLGDRGSFAEC